MIFKHGVIMLILIILLLNIVCDKHYSNMVLCITALFLQCSFFFFAVLKIHSLLAKFQSQPHELASY